MPTTIRTREPRELLSLIPYQLGFEPAESAVLVSLRGPRSQVGLVARVDLADLGSPESGPRLARSLVTHLVDDGARRAVLVLYTAVDPRSDPATSPAARARDHLAAAGDHFLGAMDCWVVSGGRYFNADCADPSCCPARGRPVTELGSTAVSAEMVLSGATVAASREQLARIGPAPASARRYARRAAARWRGRLGETDGAAQAHRWRRDGVRVWRTELARAIRARTDATDAPTDQDAPPQLTVGVGAGRGAGPWAPPGPAVVGRLQAALEDVLVRDAVMLGFVAGTDHVADRVVAGDAGADVGVVLSTIVDPVHGLPPDRVRLDAARSVLEQVVAHAPRRGHPAALTLLAVLAWWEGDGARAGVLLEQALGTAPDYRLALLVDEALAQGMPPGWLRAERGA